MECAFIGQIVPPGETVQVRAEFDEDMVETIHFTQAALGPKAKPGPHTIFISKGGQKFAVGTLDTSRCTQFSCDITFSMDEVELSHSGPSEVHLTGYRVEQMVGGSDDDEGAYGHYHTSDEEEEEEEEEEGGSESEDEEAPAAVPLKGLGKKAVKPRARSLVDDEAEEASSEEDEDDDMEDEDEEESDEDLEDTEDDSEEQQQQQKGERRKAKKAFRLIGDDDEDSSEPESLSSGEEEEEDEEEEEEEEEDEAAAKAAAAKAKAAEKARAAAPAPAPVSAKKQQRLAALEAKLKQHAAGQGLAAAPAAPKAADKKRPAADAPAQTPQPAKKAKAGGEQQKAPATAPAKVAPAGMANPGNEKEYIEALKAALKGGALKLAALGSKVKRPAGVPKVKHFIDKHPATFKYDKDNDQVSLA
ncbi:hypothetical protein ABPG77_009565 [Micractinium sp. CCAP 211/92]